MLDVDKFKGAVAEQGLNQRQLARMLGISENTMYSKVKKGVFGSNEISQMAKLLHLDNGKIVEIFFANSGT